MRLCSHMRGHSSNIIVNSAWVKTVWLILASLTGYIENDIIMCKLQIKTVGYQLLGWGYQSGQPEIRSVVIAWSYVCCQYIAIRLSAKG